MAPGPQAPLGVPVGLEISGRPYYSEPVPIEIAYGFEQLAAVRQPPESCPSLPVS
ncbi:MAG: hypothetical protein GX838_03170 [Clostridiaceae bacterium]|nr:hypothetical protein [Clostridiaceae bacterium]